MTMRKNFEAWMEANWRQLQVMTARNGAEFLWQTAYREALEQAAQLVELEYAADKKMQDRLKQIAGHIRDLSK